MISFHSNPTQDEFLLKFDSSGVDVLLASLQGCRPIAMDQRVDPHFVHPFRTVEFRKSDRTSRVVLGSDRATIQLSSIEFSALPHNVAILSPGAHFHIDLEPTAGDIFLSLILERT